MSNEKSAQDIMEALRRVGSTVKDTASDAGDSIKDWYQALNPEARDAVIRGLIGAGTGAALTGGIAAMTPHDRERKGGVLSSALTGAVLGGGAAAGLPAGLKMLGGGIKLPGEKGPNPLTRTTEALGQPFVKNPATTAAGAFAGWKLRKPISKAIDKSRSHTYPTTMRRFARMKKIPPTFAATGLKSPALRAKRLWRHLPGTAKAGIPAALLIGALADQALRGNT
jgi:hypothetical protein